MANMEFIITEKARSKARKRRIRYEKKWTVYKIIILISCIALIFSLGMLIYFDNVDKPFVWLWCAFIFSNSLILAGMNLTWIIVSARHWIQSRGIEKLWIEDGVLYHFVQTTVFVSRERQRYETSEDAVVYAMNLDTIESVAYDEKSGRIELHANGKGYYYPKAINGKIVGSYSEQWDLTEEFQHVFYDYYSPSLIETLSAEGIPIVHKELNQFKIFNEGSV